MARKKHPSALCPRPRRRFRSRVTGFGPDIIGYAVWLYYHFPLSLRMVEEMLAARGIELTYETVRC